MTVPMTVLKFVIRGPALLVSFVLAVVVFALLPPAQVHDDRNDHIAADGESILYSSVPGDRGQAVPAAERHVEVDEAGDAPGRRTLPCGDHGSIIPRPQEGGGAVRAFHGQPRKDPGQQLALGKGRDRRG